MSALTLKQTSTTAVANRLPVNPEGKGVNGVMLDWYRTEPRGLVAKPRPQVLAEFFTSMLVLSAHFKYKPSIGVRNHLYWIDDRWMLSLIAPEEWSPRHRSRFVGTCVLQPDMTWTIEPSEQLATEDCLSDAVGRFFDAFAETLDTDLTLEDILPFYVRRMPYWQRMHANALSRSVRGAAILGGQASVKAREWRAALPAAGRSLFLTPAAATAA